MFIVLNIIFKIIFAIRKLLESMELKTRYSVEFSLWILTFLQKDSLQTLPVHLNVILFSLNIFERSACVNGIPLKINIF